MSAIQRGVHDPGPTAIQPSWDANSSERTLGAVGTTIAQSLAILFAVFVPVNSSQPCSRKDSWRAFLNRILRPTRV
jgi:hypothetical protein